MSPTLALLVALQIPTGSIAGRVTEAGSARPIEGAQVGASLVSVSGPSGLYRLDGLPQGWHRLTFERLGYHPLDLQAFVQAGRVTMVDVTLVVRPLPLPSLEVSRSRTPVPDGDEGTGFGTTTVGTRTLRPGADHPLIDAPDLLRVLATTPDVSMRPDVGGGLHVRGGGGDQNLFLLDGAPILNPHHAMGMASTLDAEALDLVELHAGVPPAEFGGRLSGVIAAESRHGSLERWGARAGVDGFVSHVAVDGPLVPGRVGALVSARRSSRGLIAGVVDSGRALPLFWDLLASVSVPVAGGTLKAISFRSADALDVPRFRETENVLAEPDRYRWSGDTDAVRWRRSQRGSTSEVLVWQASADSYAQWVDSAGPSDIRSDLANYGVRGIRGLALAGGWIRAGAGLQRHDLTFSALNGPNPEEGLFRRDEGELFVSWHHVLRDRLAWTAGVRGTVAGRADRADRAIEPRVSVSWSMAGSAIISAGYARTRQSVQSVGNEDSPLEAAVPLLVAGSLGQNGLGVARGDQLTASLSLRPAEHTLILFDAYTRRLSGLLLASSATVLPIAVRATSPARGSAIGMGLTVESGGDRWQSRLGYHLGRVRRSLHDGAAFAPTYDREHWGFLGADVRVSRRVTLRSGLWAGSGVPATTVEGGFTWESSDPVLGEGDVVGVPILLGGAHSTRLPFYMRADLGIESEWRPMLRGRVAPVTAFVTGVNLLDRRNPLTNGLDAGTGLAVPIPLRPRSLNAGLRIRWQ